MEMISLVVDSREPPSVKQEFRQHSEVQDVTVMPLDAGDVKYGSVGFERKDWTDFINSMKAEEGTDLEEQADKMLQAYDHPYLVIEGDLSDTENFYHTDINPKSARGELAKLSKVGLQVLLCSNKPMLADMVVRVARKYKEDSHLRHLDLGPIDTSKPVAMRMYGCLPGIGKKFAEPLYKAYPIPIQLATASVEELMQIEGIGEKRANSIIETFRGQP